jgi:hypothetical protein
MGEKRNAYRLLVGKPEEKRPLRRPRRRWVDNIRMYLAEFLATDPEARVRFPALPEMKVVGLERGPLSLVSAIEELLDRKVAAPV